MKQALFYTLSVWLTASGMAIIGTWETDIVERAVSKSYFETEVFGRLIGFGSVSLFYAIPLFFAVSVLRTMIFNVVTFKVVLMIVTFGLCWLPFMVLTIDTGNMELLSAGYKFQIFIYILLNWTCIWFYELKPADQTPKDTNLV